MRSTWRLLCTAMMMWVALPGAGSAQWLEYPTPGVPRTADGKPNLSAPAPRTADGRPDLSGMWGWETRANCGAHCNDLQISREFINIAATLKGGLPYRPGVAELVKRRTAAQDEDPNAHCMPRGAPRIWTDDYYKRIFHVSDRVIILTERIRRLNFGMLEVEMTIDDPASYTAPWTVTLKQPLVLDSELLDYYCLENEKDLVHMIKK